MYWNYITESINRSLTLVCFYANIRKSPKAARILQARVVWIRLSRVGRLRVIVGTIPRKQVLFSLRLRHIFRLKAANVVTLWSSLPTPLLVDHVEEIRFECIIPGCSSSLSWDVVASDMSRFFINSLSIGQLLLFGSRSLLECLSTLVRGYYFSVIHVRLVHSVICFTSVKLPENVGPHLVVGDRVTAFLLPDHSL